MLVLQRHVGERIRVGEDIVITVVEIRPSSVRIGIDAPRDINIVRTEIDGRQPRANEDRPADHVHAGQSGQA